MGEWLDNWLILRLSLGGLVAIASIVALCMEHWPRKGIGFKPISGLIPVHVQILLGVAVLSSTLAVWDDIVTAKSDWKREVNAEERFTINVEKLSLITEDLKRANKGIGDQATESCEQFTVNMENLDNASKQLHTIADKLNRTSTMTESVLKETRTLTMNIDTIMAEFSVMYEYKGGDSAFAILDQTLKSMDGVKSLLLPTRPGAGPEKHYSIEDRPKIPYDDSVDKILPLAQVLNGHPYHSIQFSNDSGTSLYDYRRLDKYHAGRSASLKDGIMTVRYRMSFRLRSAVDCPSLPCLNNHYPTLAFAPNETWPDSRHPIYIWLFFPSGYTLDFSMTYSGKFGRDALYRGVSLGDVEKWMRLRGRSGQ